MAVPANIRIIVRALTGQLSGTAPLTVGGSATLAAGPSLAGSSVLTFGQSAALKGSGRLFGAAALSLGGSAVPSGGGGEEVTITAAGTSLAQVQSAVDSASDGDVIGIPNGTASWSGGISTTKQIRIRAVNITPAPAGTEGAGTTSRNVTITNNSNEPLFSMTSGNSFHCGIGGIRFNEGTGDVNAVHFSGSGSKVPLLYDCYFENKERTGSGAEVALIAFLGRGGVMWNCIIDGSAFGQAPPGDAGPAIGTISVRMENSYRAWTTASTMGTADTSGDINFYVEDCSFINTGGGDGSEHARFVMRHCLYDGATWITHGFTDLWGGRHWESYDNTYTVTYDYRNHAGMYFFCRAGTGVFTDNLCTDASEPSNYGSPVQLQIGDNTSPGSYLMPRQPGCGHNGTSYVSDPIYIWNNTGAQAYTWGFNEAPGGWEAIVVEGRDIFINDGAKPGYTKYTYPHPFRSVVEG